jgi:NADH-quinone oxidoreductase subunit L
MADWLFLIPLAPLLAAVINYIFGRWWLKSISSWIAILAIGVSFVLSIIAFLQIRSDGGIITQHLYTWIPAGNFTVPVTLEVDQLVAVMLLVVTGVSLVVHIYSVGYMHGDPGYYRFFGYLPFFVFCMLMLILADNYLLLFVFWEGVGLSSYVLIGFWYRRRSAAQAAKKAFIVNRIGDLGFLLAIMLRFIHFGTLQYSGIFSAVDTVGGNTLTIIALLLFAGAVGKSAQLPLFVWLPDAMEGPTPVSALMHAATMVTAGVFMMARSYPILEASASAMEVVAIVGAATAVVAATIGITQFDIKKVIAYSTVSQLGYMVFALGVGAWVPAIFHLVTHAFFKGLLFLGAGSVIHGMHDEQDMRGYGNLKKYMPVTYWTFLAAALANAGLFPFAGFWSKDETIVGAWAEGHPFVAIAGLAAAFGTALYMLRVVYLTFHGTERFDPTKVHPHDPPWSMKAPLILLAIPSVIAGLVIGLPPDKGWIHDFLGPVFAQGKAPVEVAGSTTLIFAIISTLIVLAGIGIAYFAYVGGRISPREWARRLGPAYDLAFRRWYFDEIYEKLIIHPLYLLSIFMWRVVDVEVIDGTVNGVATAVSFTSERWRRAQTGLVSNYALAIGLGTVIIVGAFLVFGSSLFQ